MRPGEVEANADKLAEAAPGVAGIVRRFHANVGEVVEAGAPLADIESNDLAAARADYLNARDRRRLARVSFEREKRLREQQITSEESYLESRRAFEEAKITLRAARQALSTLGVDPEDDDSGAIGAYTLRAPVSGTVIRRSASLGQIAQADAPLFVVADLSSVWVEARLYPDDLGRVAADATAKVYSRNLSTPLPGVVRRITPNLDEATRTAVAVVEVDNTDRKLNPGEFVQAEIPLAASRSAVLAPETALVRDPGGEWQIFVETERHTFKPAPVEISGRTSEGVLIAGAPLGAAMVTEGAFFLRAELDKGSFADED
jgi:cobalt-zinc-cadmium efflux system membrane fusion protein